MATDTDKINQLPDGLWLELRDPNGDGTEAFDLVCTSEEYNALVSELETAKRALEQIRDWTGNDHAMRQIATDALSNDEPWI